MGIRESAIGRRRRIRGATSHRPHSAHRRRQWRLVKLFRRSAPLATPPGCRATDAQFTSVAQVLRFDVTKEWVCTNWSRKSTGPTDVGLFAIRVPLVMGTQMTSLAGALTYFFNAQGQVEHISFRGRTGDTTPLVQYLTQSYHFEPAASSAGEKVYQVRSGEAVCSELRLQPESILRANAPQQSIAVDLEFARPGSQRVLPSREPQLQIPQVASPPVAMSPSAANSQTESMSSAGPSLLPVTDFDQVRYATPVEEARLQWRRWPE